MDRSLQRRKIGLFRDSWKWTDRTNFSTISWTSGDPNNVLGDENCGYVNNSRACDAECSDILPFFCYSGTFIYFGTEHDCNCLHIFVTLIFTFLHLDKTQKQQIIKVVVQSNQDPNKSVEKAAIMTKVHAKYYLHFPPYYSKQNLRLQKALT